MNEIEILYLRYPVHPNVQFIAVGPGIEKIIRDGSSFWVYGGHDGPLMGKRVEIPADNVAAVQWKVNEPPAT